MAQQATENRASHAAFAIHHRSGTLTTSRGKGRLSGLFAGILLPLVKLLDERFGLFLISER